MERLNYISNLDDQAEAISKSSSNLYSFKELPEISLLCGKLVYWILINPLKLRIYEKGLWKKLSPSSAMCSYLYSARFSQTSYHHIDLESILKFTQNIAIYPLGDHYTMCHERNWWFWINALRRICPNHSFNNCHHHLQYHCHLERYTTEASCFSLIIRISIAKY